MPALYLVTLEVPGSIRTFPVDELPAYWNEESYERTQWILRDWLAEPDALVAAVPSVAVPMSLNYLIHPAHAQFAEVRVVKTERFPVERRL